MALNKRTLTEESKTPLEGWIDNYGTYLRKAGIVLKPRIWVTISIALSLAVLILVGFFSLEFGIVFAILVADLMLGVPYYIALSKISALEDDLPDALRQMATTFRSGGTYEYALKEVALAEYTELSPEMNRVLKEVQGGATLNEALRNFADRSDSRLVKRSVAILIDATRSGAPLADVFTELSEDIQSIHYLDQQRQAKTLMQTLFIGMAGAFVAPLIFGMVSQIVSFLISVGATTLEVSAESEVIKLEALSARDWLIFFMKVYIFFQTLASSMIIASMRTGKFTRAVIYFPILLFIAFVTFNIASLGMNSLLGGVTDEGFELN